MPRLYNDQLTVKDQIWGYLRSTRRVIFRPSDFRDISSYPQICRALKQLCQEKKLIKFAYGMYCLAKINQLTGQLRPKYDQYTLAKSMFKSLGVKTTLSSVVKNYNQGLTSQVPAKNLLQISRKERFARSNSLGSVYAVI